MSNIAMQEIQSQKSSSPTWALCWKQCCEFLPAMGVMTLGSLVLMVVFGFVLFNEVDCYTLFLNLPFTTSLCFAFVASFTAFVSESDNRTRSFLVNLPLGSLHVGLTKLFMIVVATVAFCAGQALIAGAGVMIKAQTHGVPNSEWLVSQSPFSMGGAWVLLLFVAVVGIGALACSFCSNPWAAVAMAAGLGIYCLFASSILAQHFYFPHEAVLSPRNVGILITTLVGVMLGAVWFPLRWLRRQPWQMPFLLVLPTKGVQSTAADNIGQQTKSGGRFWQFMHLPRGGEFVALVWQSFRQQRTFVMLISFFLGVLLLGTLYHHLGTGRKGDLLSFALPVCGLTGLMAGWLTLYEDKKDNNFQFFQQHREKGIKLLIARVLSSVLMLVVLIGGFLLVPEFFEYRSLFHHLTSLDLEFFKKTALMASTTFYSVVLLCTMIFRSHVYALGVALVVGLVAVTSTVSPVEGVGFTWMFVLPLVWLLSSVCYGPTWLSGRRSWLWTGYFTIILLAAFAAPIYLLGCWLLGVESAS